MILKLWSLSQDPKLPKTKTKKTKPAVWKAEESNCKVEFSRKWTVLSEWTVKAPICWTFTACAMLFYPHSIPEM